MDQNTEPKIENVTIVNQKSEYDTPPQFVNTSADPAQNSSNVVIKKSSAGFLIFIIFMIVLTLSVWAGVGYIYINNKSETDSKNNISKEMVATDNIVNSDNYTFSVKNGSVIRTDGNQESTIIDKADFKSTGIAGFGKVTKSYDNKNLCIESWPPSLDPSIYVSDIDGANVKIISSKKQNCLWSLKSDKIAYTDLIGGKFTDIYVYDFNTNTELNLTLSQQNENEKIIFTLIGWSFRDKEIKCQFEKESVVYDCTIDIETGIFSKNFTQEIND